MAEEKGFDDVWNYVPGFGYRQFFLTVITGLIAFQDGLLTMYPIFALYTPGNYYCASDSRLAGNYTSPVYYNGHPDLCSENEDCLLSRSRRSAGAVSRTSDDGIELCRIGVIQNTFYNSSDTCETCHNFEQEMSISNISLDHTCEKFVYNDDSINNSIVTSFDLVCDYQWLRDTLFSLGNVGLAVGSFFGGNLTDYFGRKWIMFLMTAFGVISLFLQASIQNIASITAFWTLAKVASQIKYLAYSSYTMEIVGPDWRAFAGQMNHIYYSLGTIAASVLSYFFRDWINFTYAVIAFHSPLLLFWCFVPESPRWLFMKKRNGEGKLALEKLVGSKSSNIGKTFYLHMNKSDNLVHEDVVHIGSMGSIYSYQTIGTHGNISHVGNVEISENSIKDIWRFPKMRKSAILIFFSFFVIAMVYMGISYNAAELPGSIWMNNGINGVVDAAAQLLGILVLQKIGRRTVLFWTLFLTGVTYFLSEMILLNGNHKNELVLQLSRWLAFTGKFFISGSFSVIYTYTAELFPTSVRTIGLGLGSLGGGLGGVIAPFILALQKPPVMIKWLPATIFSACSITVAFLLLLLPETMGEPLYESMASAEAAWENKNENKDKNNDNKSSRDDEESDVLLKPRLSQGFSTLNGQS